MILTFMKLGPGVLGFPANCDIKNIWHNYAEN